MEGHCRKHPICYHACFAALALCLLLVGGCATQQVSEVGIATPVAKAPRSGTAPLTGIEVAALRSTGQLDRKMPPEAMRDTTQQYTYFIRQGRGTMSVFSKRAERYLAYARKVFRSRGMPEELANLAIVESGYRPDARSPAGAAGAWQFMPLTGEQFSLSQDWWTDERLDPYEATEAAATYLSKLHNAFGDWPTAIAAYNAGEGKIDRALKGSGSRDFYELKTRNHLLDEKTRIRDETKQYVPRFMAVSKIMRNLPQLGFESIRPDDAQEVARLVVRPGTDLHGIAHACHLDWDHFTSMNKHHKRPITHTGRETYVYVPLGREREAREYLATSDSVAYAQWMPGTLRQSKTSWEELSRKCGVPASQLQSMNPGVCSLKAGETVLLPPSLAASLGFQERPLFASSTKTTTAVQRTPIAGAVHTVQPGETMMQLSRRYQVSVHDLLALNPTIEPQALHVGTRVRIPATAATAVASASTGVARPTPSSVNQGNGRKQHVVQAHESLWRIARTHGVSVEDIKRWNGVDEQHVPVGAVLIVGK